MAISKIILNGVTQMDVTQDTVAAANLLLNETATGADGQQVVGAYVPASPTLQTKSVSYTPTESAQSATVTADQGYDGLDEVNISVGAISSSYVGSAIDRRDSTDLSASGATVTAPAGYYASAATKSVASGTAGTPSATKGAVSNHSVSVTPSVTNVGGYISGGTISGTAVTVDVTELESGTKSITENGTGISVSGYSAVDVNVSGGGGGYYAEGTYTLVSEANNISVSVSFQPKYVYAFVSNWRELGHTSWKKLMIAGKITGEWQRGALNSRYLNNAYGSSGGATNDEIAIYSSGTLTIKSNAGGNYPFPDGATIEWFAAGDGGAS